MTHIAVHDDEGGSVRVTLSRAARRNAVSLAMWGELRDTFSGLASQPRVRAVLLTGAGDHFCGGADITEFQRERGDAEAGARYSMAVAECLRALMALPRPSIAAVNGFCLGGGCSLAMACDFRIAARDALFGIPAARLGIVYSVTDTRNLAMLVGLQHARLMLYSGERIEAARALQWGLVDELVSDTALAGAHRMAARLHGSAPLSVAGAKRTLAAISHGEHADGLAEAQRAALASEDYREGVSAFLERRKPLFTGV